MNQLQLDVLCGNVFDYIITEYINIKDIYNLSLLCKQLYIKINEIYIINRLEKNINNILQNHLSHPLFNVQSFPIGPTLLYLMLNHDVSPVVSYDDLFINFNTLYFYDNIVGYIDNNNYVRLRINNYRHVVNKKGIFTITKDTNTVDFYNFIHSYSNIGFTFKPKYNRLLCFEYLFFWNYLFLLKENINKKKKGWVTCSKTQRCPMKLLYKNIKHYHQYNQSNTENIIIDNNNKLFTKLIVNNNYDTSFLRMIRTCKSLDQYVHERNWFVTNEFVINPFDPNDNKYDVTF